jgi:hypothetical protein
LCRGDSYSNGDTYRYRNTGWNAFAYPNGNGNCYRNSYSNGNPDCYSNGIAHAHARSGLFKRPHGGGD